MEAEQEEEEMVQKTVLHMPQMISDVGCGNEVQHVAACLQKNAKKSCEKNVFHVGFAHEGAKESSP